MSFLLDVADPSIHFHARQGCNSPSPSSSPSKTPTINPIDATVTSSSNKDSTKSSIAGRPISALTTRLGAIATNSHVSAHNAINSSCNNHLGVPTPSMFSTMSRMIRQVSASTTPLASSPPSGATTPDASSAHASDPFNRVSTIGSAFSSPWMKPSVCDDDHMNKLVSFQL